MRASARFLVATSSVAFAVHFLYKMQINVKSSMPGLTLRGADLLVGWI